MTNPRVFADFHNADPTGRLRLNCAGTLFDLSRQGIILQAGQRLQLYSEELETAGVVEFSTEEQLWVAVVDWQAIKTQPPESNGTAKATSPARQNT